MPLYTGEVQSGAIHEANQTRCYAGETSSDRATATWAAHSNCAAVALCASYSFHVRLLWEGGPTSAFSPLSCEQEQGRTETYMAASWILVA